MANTINWDQVSALARNKHVARIRDNFFLDNPLLMRMQGRTKPFDGGPLLVVPLSFAPEGGGGGWYSGTDKFDTRIRNPITAATYSAKNAHVPIPIDVDEELAVRGEPALLNLVDAKMTIAQNTIRALISQDLYNNATNPKAIGGLQFALRETIQSSSYSYGGITAGGSAPASDTFGWWQHYADTTAYTAGSGQTFMQAADNPVSKAWGNISLRSSKQPTLIVSNWGCWNDYHNSLYKTETREKQIPSRNKELAEAGFTNLMYRTAPWVADPRAPRSSGGVEKVYLIDETAVNLYVHPARDFAFENWRKPVDQDARVAYLFWRGELAFSERRSSGVISAVTVPAAVL